MGHAIKMTYGQRASWTLPISGSESPRSDQTVSPNLRGRLGSRRDEMVSIAVNSQARTLSVHRVLILD